MVVVALFIKLGESLFRGNLSKQGPTGLLVVAGAPPDDDGAVANGVDGDTEGVGAVDGRGGGSNSPAAAPGDSPSAPKLNSSQRSLIWAAKEAVVESNLAVMDLLILSAKESSFRSRSPSSSL